MSKQPNDPIILNTNASANISKLTEEFNAVVATALRELDKYFYQLFGNLANNPSPEQIVELPYYYPPVTNILGLELTCVANKFCNTDEKPAGIIRMGYEIYDTPIVECCINIKDRSIQCYFIKSSLLPILVQHAENKRHHSYSEAKMKEKVLNFIAEGLCQLAESTSENEKPGTHTHFSQQIYDELQLLDDSIVKLYQLAKFKPTDIH